MHPEPLEALGGVYELAVIAGVVCALRGPRAEGVKVSPWDPEREAVAVTLDRITSGLSWRPGPWERLCEIAITCGHLHGQTLADAWIHSHPGLRGLSVFAPGIPARGGVDPTRAELSAALGVGANSSLGDIYSAGGGAWVDLAVVGHGDEDLALLVVECSLHLGGGREGELPNPDEAGFWRRLVEQSAFRRLRVGGFASLRASVDEAVGVVFPRSLRDLYRALARDRESSKLYQGCAYALALAPPLATEFGRSLRVTVASSTLRGFEHLAARCPAPGEPEPATWQMLRSCGELYPGMRESSGDFDEELTRLDRVGRLLRGAGTTITESASATAAFGALDVRAEERISNHPRLEHIRAEHTRLVRAFIAGSPAGSLSIACLTGAPGIGKTTALRQALLGEGEVSPVLEGSWLYLYASPRIAINDEQFRKLSEGTQGTCCLSANSVLADVAAARGARARGFAWIAGDTRGLEVNAADPKIKFQGKGTLLFDPEHAMLWEREAPSASGQRFQRETRDLVRALYRPRQRVLAGLCTATREVLEARPDLGRVVLALTLQALRGDRADDLDQLFTANARFDPRWERSLGNLRRFGRRFSTVCVMLDEITGEEGSPATLTVLRRWLSSRLVEPFRGLQYAPRVLLFISDASLATARSIEGFLRDPDAPARVMMDEAPRQPQAVTRQDLTLALGSKTADRVRCSLLRGDGYPASELAVGYRLLLGRTGMGDGTLQGSLGAIAKRRRAVILESIVETLGKELKGGGGQVLCFLQNKSLLEQVHGRLLSEKTLGGAEVLVLTADTAPRERAMLRDEAQRDALRLVLMTSSGTRGISFPSADRLIAFMSPFAPEQDLMEFIQFAWRGRGGGRDDIERRLEVVVVDAMEDPKGRDDLLAVVRRQTDMVAYALTVRAALHTRIFGGYLRAEGQRVAVVPVGRTGTERGSWHLQRLLRDVLVAANRYGNEPSVKKLRAAVGAFFDHIQYELAQRITPLALNRESSWEGSVPRLSDDLRMHACGPLLVWTARVRDRVFFSGKEREELQAALRGFLGRARGAEREKFTASLVQAARKLDGLLAVAAGEDGAQQVLGLMGEAQGLMPICWEQAGDALRSLGSGAVGMEAHGQWHSALEAWAALSSGAQGLDTGGHSSVYRRHPFLMVFGDQDLSDLRDFGRRGIARAGLIANALAGIVLSPDEEV